MALKVPLILPWHELHLVSTKPDIWAKQPMLTSRASSLARPRQKPEWSSSGCKHHPGTAALCQHRRRHTGRFKPPQTVCTAFRKRLVYAYPSWSSFSFFYALFEWCVVVGGRPVPGSHPSSRQRFGELRTQRSQSPAGCSVPRPATGGATGTGGAVHELYLWALSITTSFKVLHGYSMRVLASPYTSKKY